MMLRLALAVAFVAGAAPVVAEPAQPSPSTAFRPAPYPSYAGSRVQYVIITAQPLAAEYQRLADWKTAKGVPTVVRTIDWIVGNTRNGADLAETIRFFIRDAYDYWGTKYVLLGGDTNVVPARIVSAAPLTSDAIASDLYFACLDGTWNGDHDNVWGEVPDDAPDLYPEVFVGRIPLSTVGEARVIVDKTIAYERTPGRGDRVLLMAEVLSPVDWVEGQQVRSDGGLELEQLRTGPLAGRPLDLVRMYEANSLWPGSVKLSRAAAIDSLDSGFTHVFTLTRGSASQLSIGDSLIDRSDALALKNAATPSNVYLSFGRGGAFQQDCLAEALLANAGGGAVTCIAPSEYVYLMFPTPYLEEYADLVFNRDVVHIGEAFARSRLPRTPVAGQNGGDQEFHYAMNLLGDPELPLFTAPARTLDVTYPASIVQGPNTLAIRVESAGAPVDSAVVCLSKPDDVYMVLETDTTGEVTTNVSPATTGALRVVVTALNARPSDTSIDVLSSADAVVSIADIAIDDAASGNGNGVIDAGETVTLVPRLHNTGGIPSGAISLTLRTSDPGVAVVDSTGGAAALDAGQSSPVGDAVGIAVGTMSDQSRVLLRFAIGDDAGGTWNRETEIIVHAPLLERITLRVDDAPPLGDGDGVVSEMETFRLYYALKNYGSGVAEGLRVTLTDVDGDYDIMEGNDTYPILGKLEQGENETGFLVRRLQSTGLVRLALAVAGPAIAAFQDTIDVTPPEPPGAPDFLPGPSSVLVRWAPSPSDDVHLYQVFRSQQAGGPRILATADPVLHPEFTDLGLEPNTTYFYTVRAIDDFGNASVLSEEGRVTTVADQVAGFPARTLFESSATPALGDIDGDGAPEIVVAARALYAWHSDGSEVADGDGNPSTTGILNASVDAGTGAVTLAQIDGLPGLDIVATDTGTDMVQCIDHTGTSLPGWPQRTIGMPWATPVAADLDGDGQWEVVVVDIDGVVYAWRGDGSEYRDGDHDPATDGVLFVTPGASRHVASVTAFDIDDDLDDEILVSDSSVVYVADDSYSTASGWPVDIGGEVVGPPVVGDIDGDGDPELLVRTRGGRVTVLEREGTVMTGWPRAVAMVDPFIVPAPALADFDGDGTLEIVIVANNGASTQLRLLGHDGAILSGWPVPITGDAVESSPIVGDIDGDGSLDIVLCDAVGRVTAWDVSGTVLGGFPITPFTAPIRSTPFIGDADGDGDVDLLVNGPDSRVYVFDLQAAFDATRAPWPTYQANLARNGNADNDVFRAIAQADFTYEVEDNGIALSWRISEAHRFRYDVRRAVLERWGLTDFVDVATNITATEGDRVSLRDNGIEQGSRYEYELQVVGKPRASTVTEPLYLPVTSLQLRQNVPNPFNPSTTITYFVPEGPPRRVTLTIYDVNGARVKTLLNWPGTSPGRYVATWDGSTDEGGRAASGVYFYRLEREGVTATKKMVLLR